MECKIITRKIVCSAIFVAFALFLCSAWAADPATRPGSFLKMLRDKRGLSVAGTLPVKSAHKKKTGTMPDAGKAASKKGTGETSGQGAGTEVKLTSIDFNNVDLAVFVKFISDLTGKNFVLDRGIRDKVTVICPSKIPVDEAYRVFESVLEVYGYTTVEAGDVIKIVKASAARSKNVKTGIVKVGDKPEDKIVTQIIPLKYADANEVKNLLIPLISKDSVLLAYESTNMLIVTDVYSNIKRLLKIIETIDVTGIGRQISVIPLEYADASKMVPILEAMFPEAIEKRTRPVKQSMAAGTGKVRLIADDRANAVIMMASEAETAKIKKLITILDRKVQKGKERIHVYYLKNADAEELAKVLQMLPEKETGQRNSPKKSSPVLSKSISVIADSATNSLIIMAERDDYLVLREIIKKLDIPRSMVYIECLIAEVNVTKSFELGAEWVAGDRMSYRGYDGAYGVGFGGGSDSGFSNFTQMAAGVFPSGFSVGAMAEPIIVGGIEYPNLGAVIRAFKKDKNVHILSTPQIMTTDNEEATITVGKNIPYLTRIGTTSSSETYSNYEYKDVGISLKIKPQINENRLIRMDIAQELTKLDQLTTISLDRPATLKRSITTNVIVHDGQTIVIGGLIDDSLSSVEYRIPCLGDIPVLGWLFKSLSDSNEKTNLFVFLTPHVIKTVREANDIYRQKRDDFNSIREDSFNLYHDGDSENSRERVIELPEPRQDIPSDRSGEGEREPASLAGDVLVSPDVEAKGRDGETGDSAAVSPENGSGRNINRTPVQQETTAGKDEGTGKSQGGRGDAGKVDQGGADVAPPVSETKADDTRL